MTNAQMNGTMAVSGQGNPRSGDYGKKREKRAKKEEVQ